MKALLYVLASMCITECLIVSNGFAADGQNFCKTKPVRANATDWPSKHAWDLFVWLNHPAIDQSIRRGVPDCTKKIGTEGTTSVWETWRNAGSEVFLDHEPPEWDDNTLPNEKPGSVPKTAVLALKTERGRTLDSNDPPFMSFHESADSDTIRPQFSKDGIFNNRGGFGETRISKSTYEFIRNECLYNRQATERYAKAIVDKRKTSISLPIDSIEVKAAWIDFDKEGIPQGKRNKYYVAFYKGKTYGLSALHVLTKDTPNWFWASFHHIDTPKNDWEIPDTFGRPKDLDGTVWENYVLGGAQIDFVSSIGKPTILSDYYVEKGFQKSSCITCHATASIAVKSGPQRVGMPAGQSRAVCLLDPNQPPFSTPEVCKRWAGTHLYKPEVAGKPLELVEERGAPLPEWYYTNGEQAYFQTDFLYSIPFRSGQVEEKGQIPERCK